MEIVGVVGNVKYLGLTVDTDPAYYMPFAQTYGPRMFLVVRSSGDAAPPGGGAAPGRFKPSTRASPWRKSAPWSRR